ncbi:MAG: hypothetical protein EWV61_10470 [Microcystis aeruginosa Ma_AC_P_19900807_S300]|nr:MAG: hypothetical protein EWV61_10470 [Microcystis aeruginosa Ma_AC_P_19900807_S300]
MGFAEKLFQQTLFSHRLALCPLPDTIIVLENGKISEVGSPAELMSKRRRYYLMFTRQANSYQSQKPRCAREVKLWEKSNCEDFSLVSLSRSGVRE